MTTPKTPEELGGAIETLVASYFDEVGRVAQQALERSLCRQPPSKPGSQAQHVGPVQRRKKERRSPEQLALVSDELHQLVCARPGESLAALAVAMQQTAAALYVPLSKLRADGRVRSVGERHLTRYYPALVKAAKSAS